MRVDVGGNEKGRWRDGSGSVKKTKRNPKRHTTEKKPIATKQYETKQRKPKKSKTKPRPDTRHKMRLVRV